MERYTIQITNYLLAQSWQIAVLVAVMALVTLALKNRSAHVRYLLWLIVLAKCFVPPLLTVPMPILPEQRATIVSSPSEPTALESSRISIVEAPRQPASVIVEQRPAYTIRQWLVALWTMGAGMFVLIAGLKALRTELWLRHERKHFPAELRSEIEELFSRFGVRFSPKLWLIEGIGQPFVWGLLRGGIYLPANFVKANNAEHCRGVIGHELSHVLRFDAAVNLLQVIAQAIFWFQPFVWWANRRIRAEREQCCDEMTIARLGATVKDYSIAIVNILISEHDSTRSVPSLAIAGPVKNIEERIKTMLRPGKKFYKRPSPSVLLCVLLVTLLTVPTALVLTARGAAQPTIKNVNDPAADSGKVQQPRYPARTFNAETAFDVYCQETPESFMKPVGHTPSATGVEIPACWYWSVWSVLARPVTDWDRLVREINENKVPGLWLHLRTEADGKHLTRLTGLLSLTLHGVHVTDEALTGFQDAKELKLESLILAETQITDVGLEHLKGLTTVQTLSLKGAKITDTGLAYLRSMTKLHTLDLSDTKITDAGLAQLKGLNQLQKLVLSGTKITDGGLEYLEGLRGLQELSLKSTQVTEEGLEHLKGLTGLRRLFLSSTQISDKGLICLQNLNELEVLILDNTQVTDAGLGHLKGLSRLQSLGVCNTRITDTGLAHLRSLSRLQELYAGDTQITDAGLAHIQGLTGLRQLSLYGTKITDAGLAYFTRLTGLESLDLPDGLTDAGLEHLKGLTGLQSLTSGEARVTDAGLAHIRNLNGLRKLELWGNNQITDAGLENLRGLTLLDTLILENTQITGAGLDYLAGMTQLWQFQLPGAPLTDKGLEHLKSLTTVRTLSLNGTKITDAGLLHLQGFNQLGALWLDDTRITDAGLEHLKTLTGLHVLTLRGTQVTDVGVQQLKKNVPGLSILRG